MKKNSILPMNVNPGFLPKTFVESIAHSYRAIPHLLPIQLGTSAMINMARTVNGYAFLNSEAEWALLIDSDMMWPPEAILRLLKTAKEKKVKMVSGLTFIESTQGRIVPHAYEIIKLPNGATAQLPYAALPSMEEPFEVSAVGGACLLVHRDVLTDVEAAARGKTGYPWWEDVYQPKIGEQMGEDLVFCQRARSCGYSIWYEPRAVFLHMKKPTYVSAADYQASLGRLQDDEYLKVEIGADVHPSDEERASSE